MGKFALALSQFAEEAGDNADVAVGHIALEFTSRVIVRSPVKSGRFRANWRLSEGSIPTGILEIEDKEGARTLNAITTALPEKPAGRVLYLSNNLPYGPKLERGYSKQAPIGMVALTAMEFGQIVDQSAAKALAGLGYE